MFEQEKIVLDGAGAIGPSALLAGNIEGLSGKEFGLAIDNRLIQVRVTMPDMIGGFNELFEIFAENGSSIKEFLTDGVFHRFDVLTLECKITAEVCGLEHAMQLNEAIVA
ncbi:hypothetical protein COOONC_25923, partial [Cooperia oncophora]